MFLRPFLRSLALVAALAAMPVASLAAPISFAFSMNGATENPAVSSPATGSALVVFDIVAHTMQVNATFSGLTSNVTVAHIHCCVAPPGNVGVATPTPTFPGFPLTTSGSYSSLFDMTLASSYRAGFITANGGTTATAEAALFAGLLAGQAYFNIHTVNNPGGEIRGFATTVPEPGTLALLGLGLAGLGLARRKRAA